MSFFKGDVTHLLQELVIEETSAAKMKEMFTKHQ